MKSFKSLVCILFVSGCAAQQPVVLDENGYREFGKFSALGAKCLNSGYIHPQLMSEAKTVFLASLNGYQYDYNKLNRINQEIYNSVNVDPVLCRQWEVDAYTVISHYSQYQENLQRAQDHSRQFFQNTINSMQMNKTVYCNSIGNMTMCNQW